jgi:hypothetical protein
MMAAVVAYIGWFFTFVLVCLSVCVYVCVFALCTLLLHCNVQGSASSSRRQVLMAIKSLSARRDDDREMAEPY